MRTSRAGKRRSKESGFSYAMLLAAVVIIGILAQAAHLATARIVRAEREAELLFRGQAYQRAIRSYYEAGGATKSYPRALGDLVKDPRFPNRRHLRASYPDPMSRDGMGGWLTIRAPEGGIAGVASASRERPLKQAGFPPGLERFEGAASYAEWRFEFQGAAASSSRRSANPVQDATSR